MKEAGADIVIALSHSGIDALFTGHQHLVFPGPKYSGLDGIDPKKGTLQGKPAAMGGFWGSNLGIIDLMLERDGSEWKIAGFTTSSPSIYERDGRKIVPLVEDQQNVLDSVVEEHKATLAYIRRPVGKTDAPLQSYFALVADDPSVQIVSQAQTWYIDQMMKATKASPDTGSHSETTASSSIRMGRSIPGGLFSFSEPPVRARLPVIDCK